MSVKTMSINQIREIGLKALAKALGPVGMVRFLQQFEVGKGDYTKEKKKLLENLGINDIIEDIERRRKKPEIRHKKDKKQ